jgi:quercetin dioxygenase-like cupin family protein
MPRSAKAGGTIIINSDTLVYTEKNGKGSRFYFDRPTAAFERHEMHTTTLKTTGPSHAPHQHVETEIILLIEGEAEMTVDGQKFKGNTGDFFIAASGTLHGISNTGNTPCTYFAFKWK